jgi:hypothetical protein
MNKILNKTLLIILGLLGFSIGFYFGLNPMIAMPVKELPIGALPTLAEKTEILTLIDQVKKGTIPPDKVERYFELLNKYSDKTISVDKQNIIKKVNDKLKEKLK